MLVLVPKIRMVNRDYKIKPYFPVGRKNFNDDDVYHLHVHTVLKVTTAVKVHVHVAS